MIRNQPSSFSRFLKTVVFGAVIVAIVLAIRDPRGLFSGKREVEEHMLTSGYAQLLAIEPLQNNGARLGYVNGVCEVNDNLSELLNAIEKDGKENWFFGIPLDGTRRKGEYVNLVYVDHFERIICNQGVYYRARLNVQGSQCRFVAGLITCGTDFFTERTYHRMVDALEQLGIGDADHFRPRRTLRQTACECN